MADSSALDKVEADLLLLDKRAEPWTHDDIDLNMASLKTVTGIRERGDPSLAPRVAAATEKLLRNRPKVDRGFEALKRQAQKDAAEQEKRDEEAEHRLRPKCIECCHLAVPNATAEHCEAACKKVETADSPALGRRLLTPYAVRHEGKTFCR